MQVVTLLVCLSLQHIFTYKTIFVACLDKNISAVDNFLLTEETRREILLSRCCHKNQKLTKNITGNEFYCMERDQDDNFSVDFVNIDNSNDVGIPQCHETGSEISWKCIDMLNQSPVELYCIRTFYNGTIVSRLMQKNHSILRKCCPIDHLYEISEKKCVQIENSTEIINKYFSQITRKDHIFVSNSSSFTICLREKVVIERLHDISDTQFLYDMNDDGDFYNNFCVDLAVDLLKSDDKNNSFQWISQTCNEPKICESIPCIRKCCMVGEVFAMVNGTSKCVPFQGSINADFHKIEKWSQRKVQKVDVDGKSLLTL